MGIRKIFISAVAALLVAAGAQAATRQWVHVHVEDAAKSEKVKINIPLSLVETMVPLIEEKGMEKGRLHLENKEISVQDLRKVWKELRDAGDMDFMTIENPDTNIRVGIEGNFLLVQPQERAKKSKVNIRIPLQVVDAMLSGKGEELNLMAAIRALQESGVRDIITVEDRDTTVRVWIDESNVPR